MRKVYRNISVLNLMQYKFPLTAIVSILHRVSGVLLFLFIPCMLWALEHSLASEKQFVMVKNTLLGHACPRFFFWVFLSALSYHFVAGLKHLMMDHGFFETKCGGKLASMVVLVVSICLIVLWGIVIW